MLSLIKKKLNFKFMFMLLFTSIFISFIPISQAHATIFPGTRLNTGAFFTAWYDYSVLSKGYEDHYDAGRNYWNLSNAKVYITKNTGTYQSGQDKYFVGDTSDPGVLGNTKYYKTDIFGTYQVNATDDFTYCVVVMYDNQMRASGNYNRSTVMYNAAHEIGHTVKMDHVNEVIYVSSVMYQGFVSIPCSITTYDENEAIRKWGGY